jgi:hypothetical protein
MDDNVTGVFLAMAPALDTLGAVNFFGINKAGAVLHARQSPPCTSTWTGWTTPGIIRGGVQSLAAGTDGDDCLVLVATDQSRVHNVNSQYDVAMQQWGGWNPFSMTDYPTQLALDYNSDGRLTLFSHWINLPDGKFGGLWCISQMEYNSTEWELAWTMLAPGDIRQFAIVRDLTPPVSAFR